LTTNADAIVGFATGNGERLRRSGAMHLSCLGIDGGILSMVEGARGLNPAAPQQAESFVTRHVRREFC
jgi:hypothetical protein